MPSHRASCPGCPTVVACMVRGSPLAHIFEHCTIEFGRISRIGECSGRSAWLSTCQAGPLQFNLVPLQIKPGFLQLKFGSLHLKSGPHDARELSRTWRFQRVSNLITLPVGRNATPRRRNSSTWDTKPFLKMFISGQN